MQGHVAVVRLGPSVLLCVGHHHQPLLPLPLLLSPPPPLLWLLLTLLFVCLDWFFCRYAEAIALSAVDAAVHTLSGFSLFALQWGGLPPSRIRLLPRYAKDLRGQPLESCGDASYVEGYYRVFRFGVEV